MAKQNNSFKKIAPKSAVKGPSVLQQGNLKGPQKEAPLPKSAWQTPTQQQGEKAFNKAMGKGKKAK